MFDLGLNQLPTSTLPLLVILPLLGLFLFSRTIFSLKKVSPSPPASPHLPKSYPIVGSALALLGHQDNLADWLSTILNTSPSLTFPFYKPLGQLQLFTANPANVEHILKNKFPIYEKGEFFASTVEDLLGRGIFNVNGSEWKYQRQVASHEFNTKSLRKFIEEVVDLELNNRLIPILSDAAENGTVLDLQDILKRFGVDNICKIAFGYDPECLAPAFPDVGFATAFEQAADAIGARFRALAPLQWKIKKYLNIGSEKRLKEANARVRDFARKVVRDKKDELASQAAAAAASASSSSSSDLLSRFLISGHEDEDFVIDIVISFIIAGRDTTSAALTWFFWLLSHNPRVEKEILNEIAKREAPDKAGGHSVFDDVKQMAYTHASLSESMRLYPPVTIDSKQAIVDDVLPDGTELKKGTIVAYVPYAMGRSEKLWGKDWAEFRPERWLQKDRDDGEWRYVPRDPYTYPVFQAGPRICLGKEMAYLQMKRVVAGILSRFKVVPAKEEGGTVEPVLIIGLTANMKGGFPVRVEERIQKEY